LNQEVAERMLFDGASLFSEFTSWVDAGTLLGLVRDNRLIPNDTDVDFAVSLKSTEVRLIPVLEGQEVEPVRAIFWRGLPMQNSYLVSGEILDFYFFYSDIDIGMLVNVSDEGVMRVPTQFVHPTESKQWEGLTLPFPKDSSMYLQWRYGESWETPKPGKRPWNLDHPNIEPIENSLALQFRPQGDNPESWGTLGAAVPPSTFDSRDFYPFDLRVYARDATLRLWSQRNQLRSQMASKADSEVSPDGE